MKKFKKLLSIILAIIMIATTIPFAFAADETPDFSDAKILTVNSDGILCIDGVPVNYSGSSIKMQYIPDGKYKLSGDISTGNLIHFLTDEDSDVKIDLNGYTWNSSRFSLYVCGSFSVYDTSVEKTGKIINNNDYQGLISTYNKAREINLYSGTLENIYIAAQHNDSVINLYGGKIKSDYYTIQCRMAYSCTVNLYDTVLEISEGAAHIQTSLSQGETAQAVINVADYTGDGLTINADINSAGKIKILQGDKNAEEAEKYNLILTSSYPDFYLEKTEYDEATGELFAYVVANAFTQQPSAENNYTVDFNNPDATFKWCEAEKTVLTPENTTAFDGVTFENGKWLDTAYELFTVSVQAGDLIRASTSSDSSFDLNVYTEDYSVSESINFAKTAGVTINADAEVIVSIYSYSELDEIAELEFELIRTSEINEKETEKNLQHPECGKTYCCKATVGESDYFSDVVTATHTYNNGICSYCGIVKDIISSLSPQIRFQRNADGSYAEKFDVRTRATISDEDFTTFVGATNAEASKNIKKAGFVYSISPETFSIEDAETVAKGGEVAGYTDAPVKQIQDAEGYYMFTCLVTDIPSTDTNYTLVSYAYICVEIDGVEKWYFMDTQAEADFNSLYATYYPVACEKYGW